LLYELSGSISFSIAIALSTEIVIYMGVEIFLLDSFTEQLALQAFVLMCEGCFYLAGNFVH
jgi:hypothetical protein